MSKPLIRWGIIGCGNVTELKSGPAYQKTAGFELAAVMRRDRAKAEDYATRHGVSAFYSDADDIINNDDIDAVYIATPPDSHMYYALKVAQAGKPCCIEKPMAPNYQQCVAIEQAFKAKNLPLFVAYYRRSLPRFNQVKTWLDQGDIGEVRHINWRLTKPPQAIDLTGDYNWRTDSTIAPGGYFDDLASHGLDLFTYLLGNIETVKGLSTNQQGLYGAKDAITAVWQHQSGATGSGCWNFGCEVRQDHVEILGSKGKITFSIFDHLPLVLSNKASEKELFIEHPENIQLHHVEDMRDALLGNKVHPSSGLSGSHTSWVMDQVLASA
ncbi:MAG: 1,5-anhydro-D-fructose reductase (1,5-anhydro-D-mannitol-forming) [Phenylobacterium sp.]|jgi:1,5-anhydro-D-fructose reductase (1,5-anhydro-D-mannitol-forming)